MLTKLLIFS